MPVINGIKMACEPCIRGHRSTKCTHANERLMVPVRKPGRPLSSCPHPASRPCSCAAVTAAIPRKQTCHCGTSSKHGKSTNGKKSNESSNAGDTPPSADMKSPSSSSSSSFKVQKQPTKSSTNRRQSIDIQGLGRMDPNQLNILNPLNGMHKYPPTDLNGSIVAPGTMGSMGNFNGHTPGTNDLVQPLPPQFAPVQPSSSSLNSHAKSLSSGQELSNGSPATNGSCCGIKRQDSGSPASVDMTTAPKKPETKSCCSTKQKNPSPNAQANLASLPPANGGTMAFNPALGMPPGANAFFQQPSIFNYPPQYGSYMQPLQPEQWRQVMAAMMFAQPPQQHMFGMPPAPTIQPSATSASASDEDWTSHHCGCGESCQCVGCAAHPYNEATQSYVKSAWNTLLNESQNHQNRVNGRNHVTNERVTEPDEATNGVNGNVNPAVPGGDATLSPVPPQTPSDATSGLADEQNLSANDFFFVSYPFSDGCEGDMGSCPCGDDCQCIGCAIHGNAPASEAAQPNAT